MDSSERLVQSPDVVSREVGSELVLLDLASGTYFGINMVGLRIWSYLDGQSQSVAEIRDMLVAEFDISQEDAERDVLMLSDDLRKHGLVLSKPQAPQA